jgi:competence protein ComEA
MRYTTLAAKSLTALAVLGMLAAGPAMAQSTAPAAADKSAPAKMAPAAPAATTKAATPTTGAAKATELIDINSATEAQLSTLPGIADARSKAIVAGRPYKGKDDLVSKKIVPENVYNDIKDKIIAKQKS